MAAYKGFTYNLAGATPPPWGAVENQLDKDIIDTMVLDCVTAAKDTTNGHRHYRCYSSDGAVTAIAADADGYITLDSTWGNRGVFTAAGNIIFHPDGTTIGGIDGAVYMADGILSVQRESGATFGGTLRLYEKDSGNLGTTIDGDGLINNTDYTNGFRIYSTTGNNPLLGFWNQTQEDGDGGRLSTFRALGEQSGGEITTLGSIAFCHDGASDDQKGRIVVNVNTGAGAVEALRIDSNKSIVLQNDVYTSQFVDIKSSLSFTGWSSDPPAGQFAMKKIGKTVFLIFALSDTSNSAAIEISGIPAANAVVNNYAVCGGVDNAVALTDPCKCYIAQSGTILYIQKDLAGSAWTASGNKQVYGSLSYEAA